MNLHVAFGPYRSEFEPWSPSMGPIFEIFAYDTETTEIDEEHPERTPEFVLATACDGSRGVFLTRDTLLPFFEAHCGVPFICHNAAFDLRVTQALFGNRLDIYAMVESGKVWDTMILKRLLSLATEGHTARGEAGLGRCAKTYLGLDLDKAQKDAAGHVVRQSFSKFLYKSLAEVPAQYLRYAAGDTLVTWHLFWELNREIGDILRNCSSIWGYVNDEWLRQVIGRHGPLTHHIQLKAAIICDALQSNGICIDRDRQARRLQEVLDKKEQYGKRLRDQGIVVGEAGNGSGKAMQAALDQFHESHPEVPLKRTGKGDKWSTAKDDIAALAEYDPLFSDYTAFKDAEKLASTYLAKMDRPKLHPKFGYLLATGRMYCGGGFNLQNLPRQEADSDSGSIRGCFVPDDGCVFIDADYSQIELVVFAYILDKQLGLGASLKDVINADKDVHRLIAGGVLKKNPDDVTKPERSSVKAISFGLPGGMGTEGLREYAKKAFGQDLSLDEVQERIEAYRQICPELARFLDDEIDSGLVIAEALRLTPAEYREAIGSSPSFYPDADVPQSWLGWMLLKVLRNQQPMTNEGRPYSSAEIEFFWQRAQELPLTSEPALASQLQQHVPSEELHQAVRNWAGRRAVITLTGRIRANTQFCASRNTLFQGPAADGAILGLWLLWRQGYKLVSAIHDQVVVECPAYERVVEKKEEIERLMIEGMQAVLPGMRVRVESVISRSLDKSDPASCFCQEAEDCTYVENCHHAAATTHPMKDDGALLSRKDSPPAIHKLPARLPHLPHTS